MRIMLMLGVLHICISCDALFAQTTQKIGFIDSQVIIEALPEAQDAKRKLELLSNEWQAEIKKKRENLERLFQDYRTREILYTEEIKKQKQSELLAAEREISEYQNQKFGVNGEYFRRQSELMRPIQDRIFASLKEVATAEGYDFVFDRASDTLLLYANEEHNLTKKVLERVSGTFRRGSSNSQFGR
jgi:outer membrane protein